MALSSRSFPASDVTQRGAYAPDRLSRSARWLLGAAAVVVLALLATAASLRPAEQGYGTHEQLGLPPCTFVALFGIRCPSCGMTTAWSNVMHLRPWAAVRANAGGTVLAVLSLAAGPWWLISAVRGRWVGAPLSDRAVLVLAVLVVTITLGDWSFRLLSEDRPPARIGLRQSGQ
jgi:hypothetical protein